MKIKKHIISIALACIFVSTRTSAIKASKNVLFKIPKTGLQDRKSVTQVKNFLGPVVSIHRGGGDDNHQVVKKASITESIFNLVNNIAGAGILALSAGMASGTGWIPAILICSILGAISAHTFGLIGEACEMTGEIDFKGLWGRTIGRNTTYMVDSIIAFMCLACCVIYSGILGDVFTPLLAEVGLASRWNKRSSNIIAITLMLLMPLSLIKNLSALAFTSSLGFTAILYTVCFIVVRALDGSYKLGTGKFVTDGLLHALPSFQKETLWNADFTSLVLASNLGLAFVAHYNSPTFYRELENKSLKRFGVVIKISFTILVTLYIITMTAGYSTFGDNCMGNILLNYHPKDYLAALGRLATGISILFGFPLVACGAREGIIGAATSLGYKNIGSDKNHFLLVATMLAFVTTISCTVEDVSLVVGLTGAAMGSFIVYVCPAIIFVKAVEIIDGKDSAKYRKARLNYVLVPFGVFLGALGVLMTLKEKL